MRIQYHKTDVQPIIYNMNPINMKEYYNGNRLYGDDFSLSEIKAWYDEEREAYASLGSRDINTYKYEYHMINSIHGFDKLQNKQFQNVLGFGSAWGCEFEPIVGRIKKMTIVEPSEKMVSQTVGCLKPEYIKPEISGKLKFQNDSFDLITCFGTLHHIPNVSFVLSELIRVLKPKGHLLIREPIISMGDWNQARPGLTKNERGISDEFFTKELSKYSIELVSKSYCFTLTSQLQRKAGILFKKPIYTYRIYVLFDKILSGLLKNNVNYHANNIFQRISPQSVFYIISKF